MYSLSSVDRRIYRFDGRRPLPHRREAVQLDDRERRERLLHCPRCHLDSGERPAAQRNYLREIPTPYGVKAHAISKRVCSELMTPKKAAERVGSHPDRYFRAKKRNTYCQKAWINLKANQPVFAASRNHSGCAYQP